MNIQISDEEDEEEDDDELIDPGNESANVLRKFLYKRPTSRVTFN